MGRPNNPGGHRWTSETGRAAAQAKADRLKNDPVAMAEFRKKIKASVPSLGTVMNDCPACGRLFITPLANGKRRFTCGDPLCILELKRLGGKLGGQSTRRSR